MGADDASPADMRRPPDPADPLALDDVGVERLLTGTLPAAKAPPGYAGVAGLLAATVAPPTPEELAGQATVLAELRAVTRARRAAAPARRPRRRRAGLAVVVVVGALATSGVAAAASGHLPGPVREAARAILAIPGGEDGPAASTGPGRPSAPGPGPAGSAAGADGERSAGASGRGPVEAAGPAAGPALEGLCRAVAARNGADQGGKLDAAAFQALAKAAGGAGKVPAFCQRLQASDAASKKPKEAKEPGRQDPPGGGGEGEGGPPPDPPSRSPNR
jgi:hypothetical protein